jgi:hypothetical protein
MALHTASLSVMTRSKSRSRFTFYSRVASSHTRNRRLDRPGSFREILMCAGHRSQVKVWEYLLQLCKVTGSFFSH